MGEKIKLYKVLVGKPEKKETAGKTKAGGLDQNGSQRDWFGERGLDSTGSG
jgi:hypothetical protein